MAKKSGIKIANLPMKDIAAYLEIVENFSKKGVNAIDTDKVAGASADKIALAAVNANGELVKDRNTVENALQLGGVNANQFLKKDESTTLLSDTYNVSSILSNELAQVRDEMYQLKAELAKAGYVKQNDMYDGCIDAFKLDEIKYNDNIICRATGAYPSSATTIIVSNVEELTVGEYIGIKDIQDNMYAAQIAGINGNTLTLVKSFGAEIHNQDAIYKFAGSYNNGEFIFGKNDGSYISNDVIKAIVKDGKERTVIQTLNKNMKGFATKLSNYYSTYGSMVRKVEFSLAYTGNPGNIKASIYKIVDESEKSTPICELLGASNSVYPSNASNTLSEVEFIFDEPIRIAEGSQYIIALYCEGVTDKDTWKIGGYVDPWDGANSQFFTDDTYVFAGDSFRVIPGSSDCYMALSLSRELNVNIRYGDTGLYTRDLEVNGGFTRIRAELKINREGHYSVSSAAANVTQANNGLKLTGETVNAFYAGDKVVVGQMIGQVLGDCTANSIQFTEDIYTPAGADVYRVGYKVKAKCFRKINDKPLLYSAPVIIDVPLVDVMKGKESGKENISSDRLIFEAEIAPNENNRTLNTFDKVEFQIAWESNLNAENINGNPQFAGRILDLTVVTDKSYSKQPQ